MPVVSKCPECAQPVTVPDGLGSDAQVRCPLCEGEYTLGDAAGGAPPELVVLDPGSAPPVAAPETEAADMPLAAGMMPFGEDVPPEVTAEEAMGEQSAGEADALAEEDGEQSDAVAAVAEAEGQPSSAEEEKPPEGETPMLDIWRQEDSAPNIDFGGGPAVAEDGAMDTSAFAGFAGDEETEGAGGEKRSATARPGRRGRKQKNVFKEMVGAIVGGFGGLVIGYWVLNFFFGPRMDFMNVWLPFVPHTQKYWEGEADPSAKADADADGSSPSGADDAAGMAAEEPSSRPQQPVWPDEPSSPRGPPPDDFGFASMDEGPEPSEQLAGIDAPKIELELSPDPEPTEGLRRPPSIRASQLGDALKAANEALRGEGASGEIGEGEYEQLCELGRRLTFVKPGGPQVGDRKQAVQKMLEELAADPVAVRQISQLAMAPLEDIDGPDRGVLVAGVIGPINEKNGLFAAALRPMGMDKTFVLASTRPLALPGGRAVLVLGSTVHNPTENVINWEAERPLIVWHGMGVPIPQEERPASPPTDQTRQKPDPDPKPTPSPQPEGGAGPGEAPPPAAAPGAETDSTGSAAPEPGQSAEPEAEPAADEGAGVA